VLYNSGLNPTALLGEMPSSRRHTQRRAQDGSRRLSPAGRIRKDEESRVVTRPRVVNWGQRAECSVSAMGVGGCVERDEWWVRGGGRKNQRTTQASTRPAHHSSRAPLALHAALCTLTAMINQRASATITRLVPS